VRYRRDGGHQPGGPGVLIAGKGDDDIDREQGLGPQLLGAVGDQAVSGRGGLEEGVGVAGQRQLGLVDDHPVRPPGLGAQRLQFLVRGTQGSRPARSPGPATSRRRCRRNDAAPDRRGPPPMAGGRRPRRRAPPAAGPGQRDHLPGRRSPPSSQAGSAARRSARPHTTCRAGRSRWPARSPGRPGIDTGVPSGCGHSFGAGIISVPPISTASAPPWSDRRR